MSNIFKILKVLCLISAFSATFAQADTLAKDLALEERRARTADNLELAVSELLRFQSVAILASYGDYNSHARDDGTSNGDDLSRLKNRTGQIEAAFGDFKRNFSRDKTLDESDANLVASIHDAFPDLLEASRAIIAHLDAGNQHDANLTFVYHSVSAAQDIGRALYSLQKSAESRFDKIVIANR